MKFLKKNFASLIVLTFLTVVPLVSFAQITIKPCDSSGRICNPLSGTDTIQGFIQKVLEGAIKIGLPFLALAIIYSGFLFVKARGNPEELGKAKDALLYTLIGSAVLLGAWSIALLIKETVLSLK